MHSGHMHGHLYHEFRQAPPPVGAGLIAVGLSGEGERFSSDDALRGVSPQEDHTENDSDVDSQETQHLLLSALPPGQSPILSVEIERTEDDDSIASSSLLNAEDEERLLTDVADKPIASAAELRAFSDLKLVAYARARISPANSPSAANRDLIGELEKRNLLPGSAKREGFNTELELAQLLDDVREGLNDSGDDTLPETMALRIQEAEGNVVSRAWQGLAGAYTQAGHIRNLREQVMLALALVNRVPLTPTQFALLSDGNLATYIRGLREAEFTEESEALQGPIKEALVNRKGVRRLLGSFAANHDEMVRAARNLAPKGN